MPQSLIRENKILLALFEVSKVINSSFDLEKNLAQTMHVLGDFLEMERGSVFLVDDEKKKRRIVAAHGLTKDQIEKGKYKTGEGIVGRVLEKGYPVVVPDVEEEPLFLNKTGSRIKRSGISFLCVPIKFKGESIGVLSADRIFKDRAITINEDIRVLEIVASIIAQHVILCIHYMSPRTKGPFIRFNCASIPEGLLESELFGHEKGAFTGAINARKGRFELANGGTILLDEVGDLPVNLQPKILRVLQEREFERVGGEKTIKVDVRLIAATGRNLEDLVSKGKFREDLYYRLNVVPIFMPALRERKEDIPLLIEYFLGRFNKENVKDVSISPDALRVLMDY